MEEHVKDLTVPITQKHIDSGIRWNPRACPVACALEEAGVDSPNVLGREIVGLWEGYVFELSVLEEEDVVGGDALLEFINRFDRGQDVEPFTLRLKI